MSDEFSGYNDLTDEQKLDVLHRYMKGVMEQHPYRARYRVDEHFEEIHEWVQEQFGYCVTENTDTFCFRTEEDMTMFKTVWG